MISYMRMKLYIRLCWLIMSVALLVYFVYQSSWNFVYLGGLLFLLCVLLYSYYYKGKKQNLRDLPGKDLWSTVLGIAFLLIFGWFSVYTLNNYFEADSSIYKNNNHYALRLDGISLNVTDDLVLAGGTDNAFFDQNRFCGDVVFENVNDSIVQLRLQQFTSSFYQEYYNDEGRLDKLVLRNAESMVTFSNLDTLRFMMHNGSIYSFYVDELSNKDSVFYHLITPQGENLISAEHRFLIRGLSLNALLGGISCNDADFTDIHIIRPEIHTQVKRKDRVERYKDVGFAVEFGKDSFGKSDNKVKEISVSNKIPFTDIQEIALKTMTISLPLEACFSIGYDDKRTRSAYFDISNDNAELLELRYKMPLYHYFANLNGRDDNTVYVTSTLTGDINLSTIPENILLFRQFENPTNIFQIRPFYLSFYAGKTTEELVFNYFDGENTHIYKAGESFYDLQTNRANGVKWMGMVENFKQTAPFSPFLIKLTVVLLTFCLAFLLFWCSNSLEYQKNVYRQTFSLVEVVCYMILLYLVTFRLFLLWRIAVFPPVEQVSYYEFNALFRSDYNYKMLLYFLIMWCILVFLFKGFVYYQWGRGLWSRLNQLTLTRKMILWLSTDKNYEINSKPLIMALIISFLLMIGCVLIKKPFVSISGPVVLYFLNVLLINYYVSDNIVLLRNNYSSFSLKTRPGQTILFSILNGLFASTCLICADSGFGILFFTFLLFWFIFRLHDYCKFYLLVYREKRIVHLPSFLFTFLLILLVTFICNYKLIIGFVYTDSFVHYLIVSLAGLFVFYVVMFAINHIRGWKTLSAGIAFSVSLFIGCLAFNYYLGHGGQHTAQRIVVHFKDPVNALQDIKYKETANRYFQTSLNHMIIGEYNARGADVSLIGEGGHGYFKLHPHSKVGALWNAQLTDISLVRYVVAEHSKILPLLLIGCFFLLLLTGLRMPARHWGTRSILVQIPLLLFIQSLLIWMANTQRFIFLGQDFPMVSINSRLTLIYYFVLTFIWICVAIYEKTRLYQLFENGYRLQNERSKRDMFQMSLLLIFCFIFCFYVPQNRIEKFNVTDLFVMMQQEDLKRLNADFKAFQDSLGKKVDLRRDMSALIAAFDKQYNGESYFKKDFGKQLWRNYVQFGSKDNSPQAVMHVHYTKVGGEKYLIVDVLNKSYNKELPRRNESSWRGNIISVLEDDIYSPNKIVANSFVAYRLPSDWLHEEKDKVLIASDKAFIVGEDTSPIDMSSGINSVAVLQEGDHILVDGDVQDISAIKGHKTYFARNVLINGQRTFVYPFGDYFYWIRNFAVELKEQKSDEFYNNKMLNKDIEITLSSELLEKVYPYLEKTGLSGCGVIAADGNGGITLMADYKRGFQLDPNDVSRIEKLSDSLYMTGDRGSEIERNYFSNLNLIYLNDGPGSTQKPVVWTAVASCVDLPWKNISIADYKESIPSVYGNFVIEKFNGTPFLKKHPLRTLISDENYGKSVNLSDYMMKSSNVYNATMIYIGSFPRRRFHDVDFLKIAHDHDGNTLFNHVKPTITGDNYREQFPILRVNNGVWMSLNSSIQKEYIEQSVLHLQLKDLFDLGSDIYDTNAGYGGSVSLASDLLSRTRLSNGYAYAEYSYLNAIERSKMLMENGIRSTAIGAQKVWEVTPFKMAEMFGRLVSLDKNYTLTLSQEIAKGHDAEICNSFTKGYNEARPLQLGGMNRVISSDGTARGMLTNLHVEQMSDKSVRYGKYYLYAKTGTINSDSRNHLDRHRLGVVITNQDMTKTPVDELDKVKFYVVYFTFDKTGYSNTYAAILKEIMESETFKRYME